jgi:antitoxin component HigA of HigAB toxin-antitoxin module
MNAKAKQAKAKQEVVPKGYYVTARGERVTARELALLKKLFSTKTPREFAALPKDYIGLCCIFLPRRIQDQEEYDATVAMAELMAGHDLSPDQEDYFDTLSTLIEAYDAGRVEWERVSGLQLLKSILEEGNLSGADLSRILGVSRMLGPMILRGEREITASHARILGEYFHVRPGAFIE